MSAAVTARSITHEQIRSLRNAASSAGDSLQAAICDLAIDGTIDTDDWTVLEASEVRRLRNMSQDDAVAACVEAINDASAQERP